MKDIFFTLFPIQIKTDFGGFRTGVDGDENLKINFLWPNWRKTTTTKKKSMIIIYTYYRFIDEVSQKHYGDKSLVEEINENNRILMQVFITKTSPCNMQRFFMSPQPKVGDILFLVRIPSAFASASAYSFFPTRYLLNQWMDFNQTCIDTWLGWGKELIRFWWPWPHFQGHQPMKTDQIRFSDAISSEQMNGFWPNLHKSIVGRRLRVD